MTVKLQNAIRGNGFVCLTEADHNAFVTRLEAAEELLEQADMVIEVLLGDGRNALAQEILVDIERHWEIYQEPEEEPVESRLVVGQCPACFGINRHEPNCQRWR